MKGGFEQLPNYIKGIGEPCCTPDLFRLLAETTGSCRRRIIVHRQEPVHRRPPNALPQHRIRSARSDIRQPLASFIPVCAFGTAPERGVLVRQDDYRCPPNPDRPLTKPRFPPPGFLRSALRSQFEFSDRKRQSNRRDAAL
jgi:hypothetical protein